MLDCGVAPECAERIYSDAFNLYHRLLTITDLNEFNVVDAHVLSSLLILIRENFELNESFR